MRDYSVIVLFLLAGSTIAPAAGQSWNELMQQSQQLWVQGKFAEAEAPLLAALKEAEKLSLPDIRLAETRYCLGKLHHELGRLAEAQKSYQQSLAAWKAIVGEADPSLHKPLTALASLYMENGLPGKAERLLEHWLRHPIETFDAADLASVRFVHNLAALQHSQRRYSRAETLYRQALAAAENVLGPADQEVALVLNNLGLLLAQDGRPKEAGPYLERALAIWESVLGPHHPSIARALTNLAAYYRSTGNPAKAEPLFVRALQIAETVLGSENPLTGKVAAEYAVLLRKTKRKKEAELLERRAQAIGQGQDLERNTVDVHDLLKSR